MLLKKLVSDLEAKAGLSRTFQAILAASILTNVFMASALATMDKTVRTVMMPPEVTKSFWVDGRSVSPEYLEQMGTWVIQQFANVTPGSADYQKDSILRYVHPSVYGDLNVRFQLGANRLKAENISKYFFPREVRLSQQMQAVALIGVQQTWIADKRAGDEMKAFLVSFHYDGAKVTIKELRETGIKDPFAPQGAVPEVADAQQSVTVAVPQASTQPSIQSVAQESSTPAPQPAPGLPPAPQATSAQASEALQTGALPQQNSTR